jgi:hypothetical protein
LPFWRWHSCAPPDGPPHRRAPSRAPSRRATSMPGAWRMWLSARLRDLVEVGIALPRPDLRRVGRLHQIDDGHVLVYMEDMSGPSPSSAESEETRGKTGDSWSTAVNPVTRAYPQVGDRFQQDPRQDSNLRTGLRRSHGDRRIGAGRQPCPAGPSEQFPCPSRGLQVPGPRTVHGAALPLGSMSERRGACAGVPRIERTFPGGGPSVSGSPAFPDRGPRERR